MFLQEILHVSPEGKERMQNLAATKGFQTKLDAYKQEVGRETDLYEPFVELANFCLGKFGLNHLQFCRNDPTIIRGSKSSRKPDVVNVEGEALGKKGRGGVTPKHMHKAGPGREGAFHWPELRSFWEFKVEDVTVDTSTPTVEAPATNPAKANSKQRAEPKAPTRESLPRSGKAISNPEAVSAGNKRPSEDPDGEEEEHDLGKAFDATMAPASRRQSDTTAPTASHTIPDDSDPLSVAENAFCHEEVVAADTERLARADAIAVKRAEMLAAIAALDVAQDAVMAGEEEHQIDSTTDLPLDAMDEARLSSRICPKEGCSKGKGKAPAPAPSKRAPKRVENTAAAASSKAGISKAWAYKATAGSTPLDCSAPRKNTMVEVFDVPDSDDTPTRAPGLAAKAKARLPSKSSPKLPRSLRSPYNDDGHSQAGQQYSYTPGHQHSRSRSHSPFSDHGSRNEYNNATPTGFSPHAPPSSEDPALLVDQLSNSYQLDSESRGEMHTFLTVLHLPLLFILPY
ncbi:hypothetical protein B0H10DRAFT_2220954 [Mycena sp. CBHHK59/15]|nr:hypothetical protein B0H10DRAFT_2220954 [Mycena sp. CBHHK59/15]